MDALSDFERAVLEALLTGEEPMLVTLREQARVARLASRELTGVGFFLNFEVPTSAPAIEEQNFAFGDVNAQIDGLHHGAGFVLFITNGRLSMLEGFSYAEPWPAAVGRFTLSYEMTPRELRFNSNGRSRC